MVYKRSFRLMLPRMADVLRSSPLRHGDRGLCAETEDPKGNSVMWMKLIKCE